MKIFRLKILNLREELIEKYEKMSKDAEDRLEKAKSRINRTTSIDNDIDKMNRIENVINNQKNSTEQNLNFRPLVKLNNQMNASKESEEIVTFKTQRKLVEGINLSTETPEKNLDDENMKRFEIFKTKNIHGHSSNSTVQSILYPNNEEELKPNETSPVMIHLRLIESAHHSIEKNNQIIDEDLSKQVDVFKNMNTHGHASDSTLQTLLYSEPQNKKKDQSLITDISSQETQIVEVSPRRTHIKLVEGAHHSVVTNEKKIDDEINKRLDVFKNRNTYGHSSDSTVQNLLYAPSNEQLLADVENNKQIKKAVGGQHISQESNQLVLEENTKKHLEVFKNRNFHGHSSDSSVQDLLYAENKSIISNDSSNKMNSQFLEKGDIFKETKNQETDKTHIKLIDSQYATKESNIYENDQKRLEIFRQRNTHGHASNSQMQNLLYGGETETLKNDLKITSKKQTIHSFIEDQYIQNQKEKEKNKKKVEKAEFYNSIENQPLLIEEEQQKTAQYRPSVKMNKNMHATKSTIQNKIFDPELYNTDYNYDEDDNRVKNRLNWTNKEYNWDEIFAECIKPYDDNFNFEFNLTYDSILLDNQRDTIIFENEIFESPTDNHENDLIVSESNDNNSVLFSFSYISLDEILKRLLIRPIEIQTSFVNKCLLNYFFQKTRIEEHFIALRKYFLFEDCEFAFTFVSYLCSEIFSNNEQKPIYNRKLKLVEIFNPININEALNSAKSSIKNCKYIDNLSICINEEANSDILQDSSNATNSSKAEDLSGYFDSSSLQYCSEVLNYFNNLELKYSLNWPLNIVITDLCLKKYNQVFCFLLQIKFCHITLNNIWLSLKRVGMDSLNFLIFAFNSIFFRK